MTWETVIGLETHVELATRTKIFCACTTEFGGAPNTHCCPVCTGMPGALPVMNEKVLEFAVKAGLALHCEITRYSKFDRKNYFYPDLPKAYQVSQLYLPIARNGAVPIKTGKTIRIHELHMEEDAGKLVHDPWIDQTRADYNRCGVPLIEIVTEPDFRSGEEVIAYLEKLRSTLQYLEVSDCKMQEGSLRADINLSVRPAGSQELGVRTEMKNMNSFRAIARAIESESQRQIDLLESGERVIQQTRRWDDSKGESTAMRSKEDAQDYKYFPEPDLPPISISDEEVERVRAGLPELPEQKKKRYMEELGLSAYDTDMITGSVYFVRLFERTAEVCGSPKEAANWIMGDLMKLLNDTGTLPENMAFQPDSLGKIILMLAQNKISRQSAKKVFEQVFKLDVDPEQYVKENNLGVLNDTGAIRAAVEEVLAANEKSVNEYKGGKTQAFQYLIGQSMRALRGKAPAQEVTKLLKELLGE